MLFYSKTLLALAIHKKRLTFVANFTSVHYRSMINRTLIRVKALQLLYAYYKSEAKTLSTLEKELAFSVEKTYDLYFYLLSLAVEITRYAEQRIDARRHKLRPTSEDLNPNTRFIDNRFVAQLSNNETLNSQLAQKKLSWADRGDILKELFLEIEASDFYVEYMSADPTSIDYSADRELWRKIYKRVILANENLDDTLEEENIYWADDVEVVISFVIKTVKRFDPAAGTQQELLPMYKDLDDAEYGRKLLRYAIEDSEESLHLIDKYSRNWELERIAFMDTLIMQLALAELKHFPTIPVNVTLNEYIEISKSYSTDKSAVFINGVLDKIVQDLKQENKLIKAVVF